MTGDIHLNEGTAFRFVLYGCLVICLFFAFRLIYKIIRDYYIAKFKSNAPEFRQAKSVSSTPRKATHATSPTPTPTPVTITSSGSSIPSQSTPKTKPVGIAAMPMYFKV